MFKQAKNPFRDLYNDRDYEDCDEAVAQRLVVGSKHDGYEAGTKAQMKADAKALWAGTWGRDQSHRRAVLLTDEEYEDLKKLVEEG